MDQVWQALTNYFTGENAVNAIQALLLILVGLLVASLTSRALVRLISRRADEHQGLLIKRLVFYSIASLFVISALVELGFNFSILLGAAGILTVAIGFASQTSASNVISGLFLLGEKAFGVGDIIKVGETVGVVYSIDLLSVKLRTFDNIFVRISNENLIQSEIQNWTRFPIRRVDLQIGVDYREDMRKVMTILDEVAEKNPHCLDDPKPLFIYRGYGDSALEFQYSVWTLTENILNTKSSVRIDIKEAFDRHGISIPFPHRTLYSGSETGPFPIQIIETQHERVSDKRVSDLDANRGSSAKRGSAPQTETTSPTD